MPFIPTLILSPFFIIVNWCIDSFIVDEGTQIEYGTIDFWEYVLTWLYTEHNKIVGN